MITLDRTQAACRDEDPELFFPIGKSGGARAQTENAKAVCRRCPIISECRQWSIDTMQEYGVWGGLDEDQRRIVIRRGVQLAPVSPPATQHEHKRALQDYRYQRALQLRRAGKTLEDIAWEMQIAVSTVEKYLRAATR